MLKMWCSETFTCHLKCRNVEMLLSKLWELQIDSYIWISDICYVKCTQKSAIFEISSWKRYLFHSVVLFSSMQQYFSTKVSQYILQVDSFLHVCFQLQSMSHWGCCMEYAVIKSIFSIRCDTVGWVIIGEQIKISASRISYAFVMEVVK